MSEVFYQDDGRKNSLMREKNLLRESGHFSRGSTVKLHPKEQEPHRKRYMNSLRINPFDDYGGNPVDPVGSQNIE